ncbi:VWA domain-containing protein [Marinactinospora thermotolerans]|uniref:Ca-activated chloride channel family protein n=1 Tax=Marinactinospora thermotolerans DSM 45154 TaxID=1122192 RepID=A0A1T4PWM8_9ACTN|nr:VWA domain-containing protein [Marinactinospora thermotolerans]SJZ95859.1 Ca-activated chloride channel family protein [Marinactinospora thermotolerans DSM 45154]
MTFLSAGRLWLLLAVLALVAAYLLLQRRRTHYALRFTNLALLDQVAPARPGWRRHVTAALFLATLTVLVLGFARPAMPVEVPRERATIIVAIDVSPSMAASDVDPDRLTAAKESAQRFVEALPDRFNVGLVAFSSTAAVISSPTHDHQAVADSIATLQISPGTAIGEGVFTSLQSISSFDEEAAQDPPPAAIVLLSDGENTSGRPVSSAVDAAADAQVPVSTIAFGTGASIIEINGQYVEANIDKAALEDLAEGTQGHFYEAESEAELEDVYDDIGSSLGTETIHEEVVTLFVGVALALAAATAVASLLWFQRLP